MPSIKDHTTVQAIAREYCSNGRNKTAAMVTVGYKQWYADGGRGQGIVYGNERVINAIEAIDSKRAVKAEHTREIAIEMLTSDRASLKEKADDGNIQAIQARTAITRELDAISNLHSSTITTKTEVKQFKTEDQPVLEEAARALKLKLA